jgi:fatty acid-binding protein DegV
LTDIIRNGKKTAGRVTVPIQIEMNDDTSNIKVDINSETKSREMMKKHFTKQTSRPSTPQQTVNHNEQQEKAEAKIINTEKVNSS